MAITVTISEGAFSANAVANQAMSYVVTVANTNASSVTLTSLTINETTKTGAIISQPEFLTPNVAPGTGNPTIAATTGTVSYGFKVVSTAPVMPGPSVQAPGGAAPANAAAYPANGYSLQATSLTSDGTVATSLLESPFFVPVSTATIPQSNGGALVLSQGFNLVNLITI